jgi:hypothetical protein
MLVAFATLGMALICAVKPNERRLALMRPLTLATIFAGLCTFVAGLSGMLLGIGVTGEMSAGAWRKVAMGGAETLMPLLVAFGCLTVSWLLIAVGLRRG